MVQLTISQTYFFIFIEEEEEEEILFRQTSNMNVINTHIMCFVCHAETAL